MKHNKKDFALLKTGFCSSILLTFFTVLAFGFAMIAIPPSGPNCPSNCMNYPFPDIMSYYPRDYLWMYITVVQLCIYLFFTIATHANAPNDRKIFSLSAAAFALMASIILMVNYWVQFSVVPMSMINNETEGIALLTQYNGHGVFIAIEELGFTLMSVSFAFMSRLFKGETRLKKALRRVLPLPFIVVVFAFVIYSIIYGLDRHYRFEVAAISINWIVSIVVGILMSLFYRQAMKRQFNSQIEQ
ncbi:MAG: hypothetical protein JXR76_19170 [Deltaproteobacteria bacterium]|nr:hypothetical protein [Deltaproteobacteria bacterium]